MLKWGQVSKLFMLWGHAISWLAFWLCYFSVTFDTILTMSQINAQWTEFWSLCLVGQCMLLRVLGKHWMSWAGPPSTAQHRPAPPSNAQHGYYSELDNTDTVGLCLYKNNNLIIIIYQPVRERIQYHQGIHMMNAQCAFFPSFMFLSFICRSLVPGLQQRLWMRTCYYLDISCRKPSRNIVFHLSTVLSPLYINTGSYRLYVATSVYRNLFSPKQIRRKVMRNKCVCISIFLLPLNVRMLKLVYNKQCLQWLEVSVKK